MQALLSNFAADMAAGPQWVGVWVNFLSLVLLSSIPVAFVRVEARWTVLAVVLSTTAVLWLYSLFGYQRILGLGHIVPWVPLVIYLWRRRDLWRVRETLSGKWIVLLFCTVMVSLVFDFVDVARFVIGVL